MSIFQGPAGRVAPPDHVMSFSPSSRSGGTVAALSFL